MKKSLLSFLVMQKVHPRDQKRRWTLLTLAIYILYIYHGFHVGNSALSITETSRGEKEKHDLKSNVGLK
jgi:hypothetical protein